MSVRANIAVTGLLLCAGVIAIHAQDRAPPVVVDPKACAPGDQLRAGERGPTSPPATTGENLSERLARTDGVICPPNVDPGIRAPTPEAGRTPVIPPPGSPGGNPSVLPK